MSTKNVQPRTLILVLMILATAAFRLFQSSNVFSIMSNVTPIGAMALFGGCYFKDQWKAYIIPLMALWLSDIVINRVLYFDHWMFYYSGASWVYASFAMMVLIGHLIKKVNITQVVVAAVSAAVAHWTITDLGVWLNDSMYTKDWSGFLTCYYMALPFLKNMLVGNLIFCGILFGSFEWMKRRYPVLLSQAA